METGMVGGEMVNRKIVGLLVFATLVYQKSTFTPKN